MNATITRLKSLAIVAVLAGSVMLPSLAAAQVPPTVAELQAMIAELMAQLQLLTSTTPSVATTTLAVTSSTTIAIGTQIVTTDNLRVRDAAGVNAAHIATQPTGARGVVVAGPIRKDGYNWYKVDYESGTDGWNVGGWLRTNTNLADILGTYVGYEDGREFIRTDNIGRNEALQNCKDKDANSTATVIRCTWKDKEIYLSTKADDTPRFRSVTYPVGTSEVTVSATFGAPQNGAPAVTGPTTVGTINWGDDTAIESVTALFSGGQAPVKMKHTYAAKGTYTITLKNLDGTTATDTIKLKSVSTPTATTTVAGPGENSFSCDRTVSPKLRAGKLACYGIWDYGSAFGDDANFCGTFGEGKTGCVIDTPVCKSGKATASTYLAKDTFTSAQLKTLATNLKTTPDVVKAGVRGLWQYRCVAAPATSTAPTV